MTMDIGDLRIGFIHVRENLIESAPRQRERIGFVWFGEPEEEVPSNGEYHAIRQQ